MSKYNLIACGGTFDLFHLGHKTFLENTLEQAENIVLGITSDAYVASFKDGNKIESFEIRKKVVTEFLRSINAEEKVKIVPIDDFYGPLLTNEFDVQAIAVTSETKHMADDINQKRKEKNLAELTVITLPIKLADDGRVLSATRIRNGEINREGRLYLNPKWQNKTLVLPQDLRSILQRPLAEVLADVPKEIDGSKTVAIGDIITQKLNQNQVGQFLSIVDFLVQRKPMFHDLLELGFNDQVFQKVKNPHGTITPELFQSISEAFKTTSKKIILVDGEEDLAVLPALLIAPLGFSVFYGQPNEGLVGVEVTEVNKERAYEMADSFDKD